MKTHNSVNVSSCLGSTSVQKYSTCSENLSTGTSITINAQASEADCIPDIEEANKKTSSDPSITTNGQVCEADCIPDHKEANKETDCIAGTEQANKNTSRWQYLPIFLQFLNQQLTSQLPLFFGGAIGLVIVAMLISQASGSGIKLKLDLEVFPAPSQIEKASTGK